VLSGTNGDDGAMEGKAGSSRKAWKASTCRTEQAGDVSSVFGKMCEYETGQQPGLIGLITVLLGQGHAAWIRRDKLIVRVIVDDSGAVTLNIDRIADDLAVQSARPVVAAHRDLRADGDDRTGQLVICIAVDLQGRMVCVRQIDQKTFIRPAGRCEKPVGDGPIPVNTAGGGNEGDTVA